MTMRTFSLILVSVVLTSPAFATGLSLFGSAGAESQLAPPNGDSPLNPANFLSIRERSNTADFALFVSFAPESERWKMKAKLRGDASDGGNQRVEVSELAFQFQLSDSFEVGVGRIIEKWGTGYGWTPTAFVGPARNPSDPGDRRSLNRGKEMVRLSALAGKTQLGLYYLEGGAAAFRAHRIIAGTEAALAFHRDGETFRGGLSLSRVFGDALELHADGAVSRIAGNTVMQIVAGGQYTWRRTNIVLEVHHATDGMSRGEWSAFKSGIDDALEGGDMASIVAANRAFAPLQMGKSYGFFRVARSFSRLISDGEVIVVANLHDSSAIVRTTISRRLFGNLDMLLMHTEFAGAAGSEISYVQVDRITTAGFRLHF